ncbi:EamA family transporter [Kistimonas asteriae]|uniref:EamA family transporter n=1 Tax=Kistimonas asteriae TaxID=517724 RepID=UPI001BAB7D91|nr:EamA family transporter [Kistimonas asteriae]
MSSIAVTLVLLSAVMHALWNALGKQGGSDPLFFERANFAAALLFSPAALMVGSAWFRIDPVFWLLLAGSGLCQYVYLTSLAQAYRLGDLSMLYPIARSAPVIVVTIATLMLGQGDQISGQAIVGTVLVVGGCLLLPVKRVSQWHWRDYAGPGIAFALLAAFATAGYTLIDAKGMQFLRMELNAVLAAIAYMCLQALTTGVWYRFMSALLRHDRQALSMAKNRTAVVTGGMMCATYVLILISMGYVSNVSYVAAFRQVSIPIGVLIGLFWFKEAFWPGKWLGSAVVLCGLLLVALG